MIQFVLRSVAAAAVAGFLMMLQPLDGPAAAQDKAFSDSQRDQIGAIVREYLMKNPGILRDMMSALEAKEAKELSEAQASAVSSRADDLFRSSGDVVLGNPKGDVTLVEFFDYNCGYCKRALKDLLTLIDEDKNLRVILKEYPILSEGSVDAARASLAAGRQGKYMEYHTAMMKAPGQANEAKALRIAKEAGLDIGKMKTDMADPAMMKNLRDQILLARALNLRGTPAYVIDDVVVPGAVGADKLREHIKTVRARGCKYC
ncbi:MAG: disulfide bond formation protein DsbA [Hyphomicrobiales bacterium]|nr:MAG: disulfide bond formation protein DsbA [Hyphomicrobiales bacterium]